MKIQIKKYAKSNRQILSIYPCGDEKENKIAENILIFYAQCMAKKEDEGIVFYGTLEDLAKKLAMFKFAEKNRNLQKAGHPYLEGLYDAESLSWATELVESSYENDKWNYKKSRKTNANNLNGFFDFVKLRA